MAATPITEPLAAVRKTGWLAAPLWRFEPQRHMPRIQAPTSIRRPRLGSFHQSKGNARPSHAFEKGRGFVGNEAAAQGIDMALALRVLAVNEEALRGTRS
jgi:hypothetical protein